MEHKNPMPRDEQENLIHMMGRQLAQHLPGFFGRIQINIQNGKYVNANMEQSIKPEKQEK